MKTVRDTEAAMGIRCSGAKNPKTCSSNAHIGAGLLAAAKNAEPAVARAMKFAAGALPGIFSDLGLSKAHLRRTLGGSDDIGLQEGHGAASGHLVHDPLDGPQRRSEVVDGEVLHGLSADRFAARKRTHRRGASAVPKQRAQRQCLTTS